MKNHASSDRPYVHIIKASAGSGKTHRLTGEYLRLLFEDENNYRHILAVTFTNKATDEMKSRIVQELHALASGGKSDYLEELTETFTLTEDQVRRKAKTLLEKILHDYSAFSISTIDRFFQQTMRAFTREMGLSGGYSIEVDVTPTLMEAIDLMLSELDKPENKHLSEWLLMFMKDMVENGKSWKIETQVYELAKQLFNETYKSFSDEEHALISDKQSLEEYKKKLMTIVKSYENELKSLGEKGLVLMNRFGITYTDFKYKTYSGFLLFTKLADGTIEKPSSRVIAAVDNVDACIGSKETENAIRSVFSEGLNDILKRIVDLSKNDLFYSTAKSILRNFNTLGILSDIRNRLHALQQENNTLFLSDTTELLNDIISDSDTPFIYEKTGTRLTNYMIDEFQDTSRLQWNNFKPLIKESLASHNFNLIVGDVKQSIYRFRNSDWRLLEEQVPSDFRSDNVQQHVLDTNWRSDRYIVEFNNVFFKRAAFLLQQNYNAEMGAVSSAEIKDYASTKISDAYAHVYQLVPEKKQTSEGQVKISFVPTDNDNDWKADVLERLPREIELLQDQGFALKDIAIVVRWNSEAAEVAETLLNYKESHPDSPYRYDIISNEALIIDNAQSVKAAIALLRYFRNPKDDTTKMMAVYEFYRFHRNISPEEALALYRNEANGDFPEEIGAQLGYLASLPFYEMVETFFALSEGARFGKEQAYIQAFLDIVLKFSTNSSSDLDNFLDWWDEKGCKKTLFSSDDQDAIRLITIHKSKGLGFGAVIMPFTDWNIDLNPSHSDIIWCKPTVEPFSAISVLPLKYETTLDNTIFRNDYLEEKLYRYIDNLNLLYVAFTRAKNRLVAFAPYTHPPKNSIKSVADVLWRSISGAYPLPYSAQEDVMLQDFLCQTDAGYVFELGSSDKKKVTDEKPQATTSKTQPWKSIPFENRLKLRLNSVGFFSDDGSRDYGNLMHELISRVETLDDLNDAIDKKVLDGELQETDKQAVHEQLTQVLSMPGIAHWYSRNYSVLNEMQVLHPIFGFSRPDRVMIGENEVIVVDYKFGENEDPAYHRQVRYYVKNIEEMGFSNVSGYVFYVKLNKIQAV